MKKQLLLSIAASIVALALVVGIVTAQIPSGGTTETPDTLEFLVRVLEEADAQGSLSGVVNQLLSELFIDYLIVPATGETREEVVTRLVAAATSTPESATATLTIRAAPVPTNLPAYDRNDWGSWTDADGDCQDTRQEVLIAEGVNLTYADANQCRVASGEWTGSYTGQIFTDPGDLDIDHMVPLRNAHDSGGSDWDQARRRVYYNDLSKPEHLIAVSASANRSKGSRGPEDWKPSDSSYWCEYATDRVNIKNSWGLTATNEEATALTEMLETCSPSQDLSTVGVSTQ